MKEVIINYMQIQALLALINTETHFLHSWYNTAESNPMDFIFPYELSIYFDLKLFCYWKTKCFFEYFHQLGRSALSHADLVTHMYK